MVLITFGKSSDESSFWVFGFVLFRFLGFFFLLRLELACELFQVDLFPSENCAYFSGRPGTGLTWQ